MNKLWFCRFVTTALPGFLERRGRLLSTRPKRVVQIGAKSIFPYLLSRAIFLATMALITSNAVAIDLKDITQRICNPSLQHVKIDGKNGSLITELNNLRKAFEFQSTAQMIPQAELADRVLIYRCLSRNIENILWQMKRSSLTLSQPDLNFILRNQAELANLAFLPILSSNNNLDLSVTGIDLVNEVFKKNVFDLRTDIIAKALTHFSPGQTDVEGFGFDQANYWVSPTDLQGTIDYDVQTIPWQQYNSSQLTFAVEGYVRMVTWPG